MLLELEHHARKQVARVGVAELFGKRSRAPETMQMEGYGCYDSFENKRSFALSSIVSKLNTI